MFLTVTLLVPLGWLYNVSIVLPAIHEPGGLPHSFTCLLAIFMLLNIEGNFLDSIMIGTSVDFQNAVPPPEGSKERLEWRYCQICDKLAPPRSWHCKYCKVCILKRNHHCGFTGYCVGHRNQRYFMCFVVYTVVGSVYTLIYNAIYMWCFNGNLYSKLYFHIWKSHIRLLTELPFRVILQLIVFSLNCILAQISIAILCVHAPSLWSGEVCGQKKIQSKYNNGIVDNLRSVFGLRMHIAWLFPSVNSPLPEDGYNWKKVTLEDNKKTVED